MYSHIFQTHTPTYMCILVFIYFHTSMYTCVHTHRPLVCIPNMLTHLHMHSYMYMSAHINMHVCLYVLVHALYSHAHTCVRQHIYVHIGIHTPCAQTLAFREAHRAPGTKGGLRQLTLLLLVSAGILRRRRWGAWRWPLDPGPAGLRPRDREVSGSSELPPLGKHPQHILYCQEALNKPPFGAFLLRFTQFVNNKIKSHFNGKERVTEHFSKSPPATKTSFLLLQPGSAPFLEQLTEAAVLYQVRALSI